MSGRRAKALRRALEYGPGWAAIDLPGCKVMRRGEPGRWRVFPPSWSRLLCRLLRHKQAAHPWLRGPDPGRTRRVVTGSTPPGPPGKVHDLVRAAQAERVTVRKPRSAGLMAALMLAAASSSGESR